MSLGDLTIRFDKAGGMNMVVFRKLAVFMAVLAALAAPAAMAQQIGGEKVSIWSGVYTAEQAKRGEEVHSAACAKCHGPRLNGAAQPDQPPSPAIARVGFLRKWQGKPMVVLYLLVRTTMPTDTPGSITDQQAIDAIAHMLAISNVPAGSKELPADPKALAGVVIEGEGK